MKKNKTISIDHKIEEIGIELANERGISFSELVGILITQEYDNNNEPKPWDLKTE